MKKTRLCKIFAMVAIVMGGCTTLDLDNLGDVTLNPSLALPIGSFRAGITDLLHNVDSTYIQVDEDSTTINFVYDIEPQVMTVVSPEDFDEGLMCEAGIELASTEDFAAIIDQLPAGYPFDYVVLPEGTLSFRHSSVYSFGYDEGEDGDDRIIRIDRGNFKHSDVHFDIKADGIELSETCYLSIRFSFPDLILNGEPYFVTMKMIENECEYVEKLKDFSIEFQKDKNTETRMNMTVTLHSDGDMQVMKDAKITVNTQFKIIGFNSLFGYIYQRTPFFDEHSDFSFNSDIFDMLHDNRLPFRNPQISFLFDSNVGVPISLELGNIYAEDAGGTRVYGDFGGSTSTVINLNTPAENQLGSFVSSEVIFDRENGATNRLFSIIPEKLGYDYKVYSNQSDDGKEHFLVDTPAISVGVKAVLPMVFDSGVKLSYSDTQPIDIKGSLGLDSIDLELEKLNLYLAITNNLPVKTILRLTFKDENGNITHTGEKTIQSSVVDGSGKTVEPYTDNDFVIEATSEIMDKIMNSTEVTYEITIADNDSQNGVYLQATDDVNVKLSAFVKVKATVSTSDIM